MTEPLTGAGRALDVREVHADWCGLQDRTPGPCECTCGLSSGIAAIEAEAAAAERVRLRALVEGIEIEDATGEKRGQSCNHIEGPCGFRSAVLRLLSGSAS